MSFDHPSTSDFPGLSSFEERESSFAAWSIDDLDQSADLESLRSARERNGNDDA
jgi:hypothetical protein